MKKSAIALCGATMLLAACEVPVMIEANKNQGVMKGFSVEFPAAMLVRFDDGREELLTGTLVGKATGNADYFLTGPTWGACSGEVVPASGTNTFRCENGMTANIPMEKSKPEMSGVDIMEGQALDTKWISAFGWGNFGNEAAVRTALDGQSPRG